MSTPLASWVVHDLNHIDQIVRVMANEYVVQVGGVARLSLHPQPVAGGGTRG